MAYKVVELNKVTDDRIEAELNRLAEDGWEFQDIRFVMLEGVRRPAMAFLFFLRPEDDAPETLPVG